MQCIIEDRVIGHIVPDIKHTRRKKQILGSVIKKEQKYRQQPAWGRTKGRRLERERGIEEEEESKATLRVTVGERECEEENEKREKKRGDRQREAEKTRSSHMTGDRLQAGLNILQHVVIYTTNVVFIL